MENWLEQKTRTRMNYEWIGEIAACEQKKVARKRIFVQTPFSHSTLKWEQKDFASQNHSLFLSISCFEVTKITTPIWLQKSWKCVNRS